MVDYAYYRLGFSRAVVIDYAYYRLGFPAVTDFIVIVVRCLGFPVVNRLGSFGFSRYV